MLSPFGTKMGCGVAPGPCEQRWGAGGGMALLPRTTWAWPFQPLNALTALGRVLWEEFSREPPTQVRAARCYKNVCS